VVTRGSVLECSTASGASLICPVCSPLPLSNELHEVVTLDFFKQIKSVPFNVNKGNTLQTTEKSLKFQTQAFEMTFRIFVTAALRLLWENKPVPLMKVSAPASAQLAAV
jgi:hypothetical protein